MANDKGSSKKWSHKLYFITFSRINITILSLFVFILISYSFFISEPKGHISSEIIILIVLLLILALSESFDNFSVGKIISLSKTIAEKDGHISDLKTENNNLKEQLISITTSVSQKQISNNILGIPEYLQKMLYPTVKPAGDVEKEEKKEIENEDVSEKSTQNICLPEKTKRRINLRKATDVVISKYIQIFNIEDKLLIKDAKMSTFFYNIDPISEFTPIFDGYIKTQKSEIFIQVVRSTTTRFIFRMRLYHMLSKIYHYKSIKKTDAYLLLLILDIPEDSERLGRPPMPLTEMITTYFTPSIDIGLLEIKTIKLDEAEMEQIYENTEDEY